MDHEEAARRALRPLSREEQREIYAAINEYETSRRKVSHDWRNHQAEGPRPELIEELRQLREGFAHQGKVDLADEAAQAVRDLLTGHTSVQVGIMSYDVTET